MKIAQFQVPYSTNFKQLNGINPPSMGSNGWTYSQFKGSIWTDHDPGLEKVLISPWLVTLLDICWVITTPQSPVTSRDRRRHCAERRRLRNERRYRHIEWPPRDRWHRCPIRRRLHIERRSLRIEADIVASNDECFMMFHNVLRVFHDVLLVVHNALQYITMFYMCFMMFYYV